MRNSRGTRNNRKGRGLRWIGNILIIAGLLLVAYPGYTWLSAWYSQYQLRQHLVNAGEVGSGTIMDLTVAHRMGMPVDGENPVVGPRLSDPSNEREEEFPGALLEIPKLNLSAAVVYGVTLADLKKGPGLYPMASWPGEKGNVAIAAHRTTWGAWFRHLDKLEPGDRIQLTSNTLNIEYEVESVFVTGPTDWTVIEQTDEDVLTLTTCDPPGTSRNRLIVRASLVDISEVGN